MTDSGDRGRSELQVAYDSDTQNHTLREIMTMWDLYDDTLLDPVWPKGEGWKQIPAELRCFLTVFVLSVLSPVFLAVLLMILTVWSMRKLRDAAARRL